MHARRTQPPATAVALLLLLLLLLACVGAPPAFASSSGARGAIGARGASGDLLWQYVSGGSLMQWDEFRDATAGPNGTMYACGVVNDYPDFNRATVAVACFQQTPEGRRGPLLWLRGWDNPAFDDRDYGVAIAGDAAGDAIVAGNTTVASGNEDWVILKWRPDGTLAWSATLDGELHAVDQVRDVACDAAGDVYACGLSSNAAQSVTVWVEAKFSGADGQVLWTRTFHGPRGTLSNLWPNSIAVDAAGYSYVTGRADDRKGVAGIQITTLTPGGKLAWMKRVQGRAHKDAAGEQIALAKGSVFVGGEADTWDFLAARFTRGGNLVWQKMWSHGKTAYPRLQGLAVDGSGHVVVAGGTQGSGVDPAVLVRWSFTGKRNWARTYLDPGGRDAMFQSLAVDNSGTIWAAGQTGDWGQNADGLVARYQSTGLRQWVKAFVGSGGGSGDDWFNVVRLWGADSLFAAGLTSTTGYQDLLAARYSQ